MAAAAAGLACKKSGGSTRVGFSKCIEDWPGAGGPHPVKPALAVDAPRLLWTVELNGSQAMGGRVDSSDGGPVLSKNRLALQAGRFIYFVNKDGTTPQAAELTSFASYPSGLVADLDGNIYFVAQDGVFSADAAGNKRWQGGDGAAPAGEFSYYAPPVLGPDGVVYAVTSNQRVFALRTQDGSTIWSQPAPIYSHASYVVGGAGHGLLVQMGADRTDALDTKDGSTLGSLKVLIDGVLYTPSSGLGSTNFGWDFGIAQGSDFVYDVCGKVKWSTWVQMMSSVSGVIAAGERLANTNYQLDANGKQLSPNMMTLYAADGSIEAGPVEVEGRPLAAGADGTIYTVDCAKSVQVGTPAINRILAYSSDLTELWRFDLGGGSCLGMTGNVVLDDDGVMYLMRSSPNISGTQVMAIQTRSPGLADSSWPSWRHDNRGTAWLVPGTSGPATTDGSNVTDTSYPTGTLERD